MERMLIKMTAAMAMNKLNENALHEIVGGTYNQVAGDSRFLNDVGAGCDRYGPTKTFFAYDSISDETAQTWNKFGIPFQMKPRKLGTNSALASPTAGAARTNTL